MRFNTKDFTDWLAGVCRNSHHFYAHPQLFGAVVVSPYLLLHAWGKVRFDKPLNMTGTVRVTRKGT